MKQKSFSILIREWREANNLSRPKMAARIEEVAGQSCSSALLEKIETGIRPAQEWLVIAFANLSLQDVNALLRSAGLKQIEKEALPLA